MKARKLVAWNLRRIRVARDLSQEALGADAGVDRAYVGRLERGLENPTIGLLERLARVMSVPMSELFIQPRAGESPPKPLKGGRRRRSSRGLPSASAGRR
jgi:transcriptional regulator with XRE-family HTH domain